MASGTCPDCNQSFTNLGAHKRFCQPTAAQQGRPAAVAVAERPPSADMPRTERGRRRRGRDFRVLTPLEQIRRPLPGVTGPYAYYIRPDGATIMDALILYPNGATLPAEQDPRGRYSQNASYYRERQSNKGFAYVGPTLTADGARLLVQTLERNRPEEILDLEDQIAECQHVIETSDRPEVRDGQRKRRDQLQARLDRVRAPLNADALVKELDEIARAQKMARVDPNILAVMREMVGQVNASFEEKLHAFRTLSKPPEDESLYQGADSAEHRVER